MIKLMLMVMIPLGNQPVPYATTSFFPSYFFVLLTRRACEVDSLKEPTRSFSHHLLYCFLFLLFD